MKIGLMALCWAIAAAIDISGVWTVHLDPDFSGNPDTVECRFKQDDTTFTVDCGGAPSSGKVEGQKVTFEIKTGSQNELTATFVADVDRDATTMKGTWRLVDENKKEMNGRFDATKK